MPNTETKHTAERRPTKPGDVVGQCPKCGERWELIDEAATGSLVPDLWQCDHCGYTLSIAACVNALAGLDPAGVAGLVKAAAEAEERIRSARNHLIAGNDGRETTKQALVALNFDSLAAALSAIKGGK